MKRRWWLLVAISAGWIQVSSAEIYRCDANGRLQFSDRPCVAGQAPLPVAEPNSMDTSTGDQALAREYDRDVSSARKARLAAEEAQISAEPRAHKATAKLHKRPRLVRRVTRGGKVTPTVRPREEPPAQILRPAKKD